jgi:MinD-like ATPase involved in chromosome partitioning or flagellar assembly
LADIVSFYSYKGGVGRSISLSNVAVLLAQQGHRVVCIDFDLEAGGLHTIFGIEVKDIGHTILDLLTMIAAPDLASATLDLTARLPPSNNGGKLWLMPAVSEAVKVRKLEMVHNMPSLFGQIIERVEDLYNPHFILVDSRSGFAELASAPLMRADKLVCVLRPNRQNADGLKLLLDILDIFPKPPMIFLVLSQIPDLPEAALRVESLQAMLGQGREFGARIPYVPELAFEENVSALTAPNSTLTRCYLPIVHWLEGE